MPTEETPFPDGGKSAEPPNRPIRVVHVCGGTRTGCTRVVLGLIAAHDRARIDPAVCFFSVQPAEAEILAEVAALGVPVRDVVKHSKYEASSVARLARALRAMSAEVAVLHGFGAYTFGALAARLTGIPVRVRVEHSPELYTPIHRAASSSMARFVDSTVLVSASLGEYLRAHGTEPPHPEVIHNGIDLAAFESVSRRPFGGPAGPDGPSVPVPVALMAARLDGAKDHDTLLDAMSLLQRRGVPLRLRLAGTGPLEESLRARAKTLGIDDKVEFLGWRDDLAACPGAADIGVLSTHYEGFGLAVVEAMAAGRPVVATRVPSILELVDDGRQGLLVPPSDARAMADALEKLVARPDEARAMGEAGRARAHERFGLLASVRAFERHLLQTATRCGIPTRSQARPRPPAPRERSATGPSLIRVPHKSRRTVQTDHGDRIRVLHVINDLGLAGAEQVVLNLVGNRRDDVECTVARLNEVGELDAGIRATGAEVVPLHLGGMVDLAGGVARLASLVR